MEWPEPVAGSKQILWDVIEEHLDEAGFCWSQWERALLSPLYSLSDLEKTIESRLVAHLDGLLVGGSPVVEKILLAALDTDDLGYVFAATYVLADSELEIAQACLFSHLELASPRSLGAMQRALELASGRAQQGILRLLRSSRAELQALALDVLSFRRTEVAELGLVLPQFLLHTEPQVHEAALRAVRRLPSHTYWATLRSILGSPQTVPAVALEAGAILGLVDAPSASQWLVSQDPDSLRTAQLLLAMQGSAQDWERLRQATEDRTLQRRALFALGFSGSIPSVDHILQLMREPDLAALAGEALSGITGVDLEKAKLTAQAPPVSSGEAEEDPPELVDPNADLSLSLDADLPVPDPDAAAAWWKEHRASFDPGVRYVHGLPFKGEQTLLEALAIVPMRRRHAIALDLAIRSRGQIQVETRALAQDQLRHLPAEWRKAAQARPATTAPRVAHG